MHYSLSEFIEQRMIEKRMLTSNGYENGDPKTNGEYHLIEDLGSFCDLFIDIGANIGDFSKKILKLYPDVDIMIFEANKELFIELYKIYNANDNNVFNIALSDKIGEIEFNINRLDSTTSSILIEHI